jgi:hypothetical protein
MGYLADIGTIRIAYEILGRKPEAKGPFARHSHGRILLKSI